MLKLLELYTSEEGPLVFVNATSHGNELYGKAICEALYGCVRLRRGRLVMLPVANPYAYQMRTRNYKGKNLNRRFPGRRGGDEIDRLAYEIFELAKQADYVIDIHSHAPGKGDWVNTPVKNRELAEVFGLPIKHLKSGYERTLTNQISGLGKVAFTLEIGQVGEVEAGKVTEGTGRLQRLLEELDMV